MVGVSVVQVGSAVRHTPLPGLTYEGEATLNSEDPGKALSNSVTQFPVLGGFVGGGQLAWRAAGPTVEIIEPSTGTRKAAWTFGAILHNTGTRVTSVCGVGPGTISQVVVGVDLGADRKPQGMVALLSLYSSRLTRVFHFTHKVTSLCMVSGGEMSVDSGTLASELRPWHGLLVVGTSHGTLHLLDLALDLGGNKVLSDEISPGNLTSVVTPDPQAERSRINAIMQNCHPTMCLSDGMSYGGRFQLIGPDDNILFETSGHLVNITALSFIPQLASLIVGYNFGAFQIINLSTLTIDCASPYEVNMPPVHSFACQEPENDPKNFVYLWLCRSWGPAGKDNKNSKGTGSHALCTMYAMNYDSKVWIEGHGLWYQGLASISPRFEFDAVGGLGLKGQPVEPSLVFAAMTVRQTTQTSATPGGSSSVSALATPDEDSGPVPEQSLCMFGWVGGTLEQGQVSINHYLAVFDINQWYQAQMPSSLKLENDHLCPYMSFHVLDRVPGSNTNGGPSECVLGAAPIPASWTRHMSRTCNDSDWFPAALSYDAHVLTSEGLMEYLCQSAQQAALVHLTSCGPSAIVSPEEAYAMCVFAGLIPQDAQPPSIGSSMVIEREALLNVALDQQLISLLVQCVAEFSEGRFTNLGCSLPSLLEWSWSRVCTIKATNDNLSLPLFDPDCGVMSSESIATLHQNLTSLASLTTIITTIRDYASTNMITLQGAGELENRVQVVSLLMLHLSVVLWFYHCGLLSHTPTEDVIEECHVPFPAELLRRIYKNRRSEIQRLSSTLVGHEVLMIDGLLNDAVGGAGGSIWEAWEREGGSRMYPPPSLHALLATFLLPDVSTTTKHRIVQYLFLDLASLLSDGYVRVVEELVKYPSSFSLSPSHIKLTQAFWLLDHKDFQEGLNVLLDPLVNTNDITSWQHRRIMKAFLYQGEHSRALTYAQIRQPPKVDLDDIRLHLTLLLANGLVREAFHYQRSHRIKNNSQDLLNHLFTGCEQLGKLECVIHLPLSPLEEEALVSYLQASTNTSAHDYLLVYYLQRARYDEAAGLQDSLRGGLCTAKKRQGARSALVHGYLTHLPDVAKRLSGGMLRKVGPTRVIYSKPQPLSAQIRQAASSPRSHTANINRMFEDNKDEWSSKQAAIAPFTPFRNKSQRRKAHEPGKSDDISDAFTPKRSSLRDTSHVVFPSRVQASHSRFIEEEEVEIGLFSPSVKRSHLGESSLIRDDVSKLMESVLRRSMYVSGSEINAGMTQNISSDLMSLLQTPKIIRKRKSGVQSSAESPLVDTPQSILKVRQMVQRPLSPSAASDTSIPVFPRLSAKKGSTSTADDTLQSRANDTSMTPKQLRFHLPKMKMDDEIVAKEQAEDEEEEVMPVDDNYASEEEEEETEKDIEEEEAEMDVEYERKEEKQVKEFEVDEEEEVEEFEVEEEKDAEEFEVEEEKDVEEFEVEEEKEVEGFEVEEEKEVEEFKVEEEKDAEEFEVEEEKEVEEFEVEEEKDVEEFEVEEEKKVEEFKVEEVEEFEVEEEKYVKEVEEESKEKLIQTSVTITPRPNIHSLNLNPLNDITTDVDEVDTKQFEGEEQEYSFVSPSKDTTNNDEFYSFTEEESVDKFTEDEEELEGAETSKEAGKSEDEEKEMLEGTEESDIEGVERSRELGESEDDRVLKVKCTEEADDDTTRPLEGDEEMHDEGLYDNMDPEETEKAEEEALSFTFDERSESTHSSIVDKDEFCIGLPSENEDMHGIEERAHDTLNSAVKEGEEVPEMCLNESEIINPLEFSDSEESDTANDKSSNREQEELFINENLAAKEKILSVNEDIPTDVTESDMKEVCAMEKSYITGDKCENQSTNNELKEEGLVVEETVVDNGMHIMDTDHEITEEEEEMIADAISDEEDDICLSLNASERFSPLRFSDSEEEKKETESCINQVEDICSNEANSAVEEKLSDVSEDQGAKILEGNNAEEKSMEADIPEEQKIEASTPAESSNEPDVMEREDEATVVLGETVEAVVPKQEEGSGVTNIDQLCSNDVQGNEGEISATTSVLKEIAGVLNEQGNEGEISATTSVLKEIGDVLNEQGNEGEISATTSVLKEIGDVLNEQRTETVTENSKYVKVDEKGYSEQDSQVLKSEEEAYQPVEISSEEVVQKTEVLDSEEVTEEKHEEMEVTKAIKNEEMDVMENEMQVSKMTTQNGKGGEKICQDSVLGSNLQAVNQEVSVKDDKIIPDNETSMEVTEETKLSLSPKRGSSPIEAANIPPEATEDATSSSPRSSRLSSVVDTDTTIDEAMVQNASPTGSFRHGEKISQPISPSSSPRLSSSVDASTVHEEITQSYSTGRSSRHSEAAGPLTSDIEKDGVAVSLKGSLKHGDDTNAFTKVTEACKIVSAKLNLSDAEMSPIDTEERTLTLLPSSTQDDTVDITVKVDSPIKVDKETLSPDKFSTQDSETTLKPGEKLAIKTPPQQSLESFCADTSLVTTPKRSVRHTHGSDSQVVVAKEDTPSKVATPLRRSRRLSSASPATPSTPNRTSKTITNAEVITPTRELFKAADVVERITRSGRKILQVPTPLTKSRSAQGPTHDTLDKRSTRGTVVPEEVEKVSQKLELSPGVATLGATASVLNHKRSVSPSTQDVLPTPPVSPTAPSARQQKTQNTEEDSGRVILTRSRRRSARLSVSEETLETIVEGQKLERGSGGSEIEEKDTVSHSTKTPIKGTPTRTRRSRRLSTTSETLETIAEDAELSSRVTGDLRTVTSTHVKSHLGVEEWSSDVPEKKTPLRTRRKSITSDTADDTPEKKTPSRRRRKSVASDSVEVTPEKKISSRRRRKSVSSDTADDTPEKKTPSQKRRKSITSDTADDTPEKKTPSRRRSVASDTVEVTPEKTASSRRGRKSVTSDTADDTPEKKTPSRRRRSVASDIVEVTPEKKTPLRRRRSVASDTAEVTPERKNPRRKLKESLGGSDTEDISQRNTLDVTASTIRQTRRRSMSEKGISRREETNALEITQISPDRMSTRSSGTSSVTSIKDSESSEEDNIIKRRFSKRQSERGGKIIKPIHPVVEELSTGRRKSRRLTLSSTLSTTAMLQLPNQPDKPSRKSVTSLKVYTESDEGEPLLTPEPDHRIRKSKKSLPSSTSILLIQGSDEDEEMVLEGGMDTADEADDEVLISASVSMAQDSPDLPLNLIEVVGKGKNKRKGSLSLGQKGRRTTKIPRRSLHSLKIHAETSKNKAEDVTGVAVTTTKLSQRSSRGSKDTSVLGMAPEDTSVLKEADSDNDDVFMENKGEIKKTVLEEEEIEKGQEGKVTMTEMEKDKRETDEDNEEHSTAPQFQFAKPKSVTSTRKVRALEYLTSEAVEFLFSPPQVAGRIVRHHAKLEEGVKTSSSESETESETGKRTSRRKQ